MKLLLTEVLPHDLTKVLMLDLDLLFLGDIAALWSYLATFVEDQCLALVENQSGKSTLCHHRLNEHQFW